MEILPHRYPLLLIDRIEELDPGKRAVTRKNVTINDWFFKGHFPGKPIMPGMLILEAMAQTSILLYFSAYEKDLGSTPEYYLGSVKGRFMAPVYPGDQLKMIAETVKLIPTGAFVNTRALVNEKEIAEADLVFAVKK
jgi:3-hydroxyacyl-[acyl-carrier-protein] dehydratase